MTINDLKKFYKGKRVLITGHTGFKGSWLTQTLIEFGAIICGIALEPSENSLFNSLNLSDSIEDYHVNILNIKKCEDIIAHFKPDILFHLAAQPLVKLSYSQPLETHNTNYMGTANILNIFAKYDFIKSGVFITTDKVYKNDEKGIPFKEEDPLGGYDPYSASKAASEILIESWRRSFINSNKKGLASARAGNVIGGGDWAADRLIPDIFRSFFNNSILKIRNPLSTRPWQHVLDPINGYLLLGMKLFIQPSQFSEGWNFGPKKEDILTVEELLNIVVKEINFDLSKLKIEKSEFHEANLLSLDNQKAFARLGWNSKLNASEAIKLTTNWYMNYKQSSISELTKKQINEFFK